jgi:hypothetical protein
MSGRDRVLIAIEEEEAEAAALVQEVSARSQLLIPQAIDDELKALADDFDALAIKVRELQEKVSEL